MHSILTYQMENTRKGCINRDSNSVNNMVSIVTQYLKDRTRPYKFRRDTSMKEVIEIVTTATPKDLNLKTFSDKVLLY